MKRDQWNEAVQTVAAYFEKKAADSKLGYAVTSYETVAAIVRSYEREPEPPTLHDEVDKLQQDIDTLFSSAHEHGRRLEALEKQAREVTPIEDLAERHRRLVEAVLPLLDDNEENRQELRQQLNVGG